MASDGEMREGAAAADPAGGAPGDPRGEAPAAVGAPIGGDADDLLWRDTRAAPGTASSPSGQAPTTPTVSQGGAALQAEVAYLSGVDASGAVASTSFWGANGADPHKWQTDPAAGVQARAGAGGGTVLYLFDPNSNWSAAEQKSFAGAMALWSAEANIAFAQTTDPALADVVITRGSDGGAHTAVATAPAASGTLARSAAADAAGDRTNVSVDTSAVSFSQLDSFTTIGGYGVASLVHEIGHLMGLGHGGTYNGSVSPARQQNGPYDSRLWTAMSYIRPDDATAADYGAYPVPGTGWGTTSDSYYRAPYTPMPLDILAAQSLYGAPAGTPLSGGQVFGFHTNVAAPIRDYFDFTVDKDPVVTLFDAGSGNTLDLSGYATGATIDLRAGHFSSFDGMTNNLGIAFGTEIDNVVGTTGRDTIVGNGYANVFTGNASGDTYTGGGGADVYRDTAAHLDGSTITDFIALDTIDVTDAAGPVSGLMFAGGVLSFSVGGAAVAMALQGVAGGAFTQRADTTGGGGVDIVYDPTAPAPAPPAAPSIALAPGSDTGASNADGITAATTVTVAGTATAGDTVTVFDDANRDGVWNAGEAALGTAVATPGGTYAATFALSPGQHSLRAVQTDPSGAGSAPSPAAAVTVDTAAPTATAAALTVAAGAGPTPIGIAAPRDDLTPAAQIAVTVSALPTDGTVTLGDGTTPVTPGESLTAAQLAGLAFTPAPGVSGQASTFRYAVTDLAGNVGTGTATLSVGPPPPAPAPVPAPAAAPPAAPVPAAPVDAVSFGSSPTSTGDGGLVLFGIARSTAGVAKVELSGLDAGGNRIDLGAAVLGTDGSFSAAIYPDANGAFPRSVAAVLTDGAGGTASAAAHLTLRTGARPGVTARADAYDPADGSPIATTVIRDDGSRVVAVEAARQAFASSAFDTFRNAYNPDTAFVFQPGYGSDTIMGFRLGGADHDALVLPSADFASIAAVLRNAQDAAGGVVISDPVSGDSLTLAGVSKARLVSHRADIALGG